MLINLTKHELYVINYYLDWKIIEIKETGNEFEYPELEDIYNKLSKLMDACECQAQKQTKEAN